MDWTTTSFYPPTVFTKHHLREMAREAQIQGSWLLERTTERGSRIFRAPQPGKRIVLSSIRAGMGIAGIAGTAIANGAQPFASHPKAYAPVAIAITGASLYNGIAVAATAVSRSFDVDKIIVELIQTKDDFEKHLDLLVLRYHEGRAAISMAEALATSDWEDPLTAGIVGERMKKCLEVLSPREQKYCLRTIGKISADIEDLHPHLDVLEGLQGYFEPRLNLGNGPQHFGREM